MSWWITLYKLRLAGTRSTGACWQYPKLRAGLYLLLSAAARSTYCVELSGIVRRSNYATLQISKATRKA